MKNIIMAMALSAATALNAHAGDIYVSPTEGNDNGDGTIEQPLRTIEKAVRQAREWRRLGKDEASGGISIVLRGGVHRLSSTLMLRPEDSGTPSAPTVIRSAEGENAVISGGVEVTGWTKGCDDKRIPEALRDSIWVADAPRMGNKIVYARQMWVDDAKAMMAKQFADGVMERMIDFNATDRTITIPSPGIDLTGADQLEMTVHQRWAIAILRVKQMIPDGQGRVTVSFHEPESRLEFEHPWPQPIIGGDKGNSSFFLSNAPQLINEPGEWYQDYPSGRIYYYPKDGTMEGHSAVVPVLETLIDVNGSRERPVSDIKFIDVAIEHASWYEPSLRGHVTLQGGFALIDAYKLAEPGLPHKAELENQAWIRRPEAAVEIRFASGIDFDGCTFSHVGATALDYVRAASSSTVNGCTFTDIGGTAIQAGVFPDMGFETHIPYTPAVPGDICAGLTLSGNTIKDATNEDWGCVGIGAGYVKDISIVHNDVSHVNYSGICVGWGWTALESGMCNNVIRFNNVHDYARQLYDAGGIYTLSNQPGSVISDNRISAPHDAPYATNDRGFCIYFDEATDGFTVENNECGKAEFGYNKPGPSMVVKP